MGYDPTIARGEIERTINKNKSQIANYTSSLNAVGGKEALSQKPEWYENQIRLLTAENVVLQEKIDSGAYMNDPNTGILEKLTSIDDKLGFIINEIKDNKEERSNHSLPNYPPPPPAPPASNVPPPPVV